MKTNYSKYLSLVAALGAAAMSSPSFAAGTAVDVTDTVATIGLQLVPIGLIGVAVLGVIVAIKAFKWVRRAM